MQRRNRRAGVEDRWRRSDGTPAARNGKGRRWLARYVDDQGGENTRSFDRKVDAQAFLNEITAAQTIGTYVAPKAGRITVRELHAKWLGTQGHLKETTVATRAFAWSGYVEGRWAAVAVADVQSSDIRAWVQQLAAGGAKPATIENALSVLRQILEMAVDDRRIPRNPCMGVKSPRRQHRARGYLTHRQVELLAREVGEYAIVVRFLAYTGFEYPVAPSYTRGRDDFPVLHPVEEERQSVEEMLAWAKRVPVYFMIFLFLLMGYLAHLLTRQILGPLKQILGYTRRIAEGDFTPVIPTRPYKDEFSTLILAMDRMLKELSHRQEILVQSHKLRAVGNLTAGVAHELNNPINNISLTAPTSFWRTTGPAG